MWWCVCVCVCVVQVCVCVVCVHLHMQTSDIILGATGFSSGIALTQFLLHHLIGKAGMGCSFYRNFENGAQVINPSKTEV